MGYDILNNDLFDNGNNQGSKRQRRQNQMQPPPRPFFLRPIFIHLLLILILLVFIGIFIQKTFDLGISNDVSGEVTIAGDLKKFSKIYNGDISLYSSQFKLETNSGTFDDSSKTINIKNFNGKIYLENNSIILSGIGDKLTYGKNEIKLGTNSFKLISTKKTTIDLYFNEIKLEFQNGNIKLDKTFNYDFKNTSLEFTNFNVTISYDNTFTFFGVPKSFKINSPKDKLKIIYEN